MVSLENSSESWRNNEHKFYIGRNNEQWTQILYNLFQKKEKAGRLSNSFYEANITQTPKLGKDSTQKENHTPITHMKKEKFSTKHQQIEFSNILKELYTTTKSGSV